MGFSGQITELERVPDGEESGDVVVVNDGLDAGVEMNSLIEATRTQQLITGVRVRATFLDFGNGGKGTSKSEIWGFQDSLHLQKGLVGLARTGIENAMKVLDFAQSQNLLNGYILSQIISQIIRAKKGQSIDTKTYEERIHDVALRYMDRNTLSAFLILFPKEAPQLLKQYENKTDPFGVPYLDSHVLGAFIKTLPQEQGKILAENHRELVNGHVLSALMRNAGSYKQAREYCRTFEDYMDCSVLCFLISSFPEHAMQSYADFKPMINERSLAHLLHYYPSEATRLRDENRPLFEKDIYCRISYDNAVLNNIIWGRGQKDTTLYTVRKPDFNLINQSSANGERERVMFCMYIKSMICRPAEIERCADFIVDCLNMDLPSSSLFFLFQTLVSVRGLFENNKLKLPVYLITDPSQHHILLDRGMTEHQIMLVTSLLTTNLRTDWSGNLPLPNPQKEAMDGGYIPENPIFNSGSAEFWEPVDSQAAEDVYTPYIGK